MLGDKFNLEYVWIYWLLYIFVVGVKLFVLALAAILIEFVYVVALIPGNFVNSSNAYISEFWDTSVNLPVGFPIPEVA